MVSRPSWGPDHRHGTCSSPHAPPLPLALLALVCSRPLPVVLAAPSCSTRAAPRVFPSRAVLWSRLTAPLPSCRHSCSSASATGPVESRSAAGVARSSAPSEPLHCSEGKSEASCLRRRRQQGNAGLISTADRRGGAPNARCGARFWVKLPRAVPCGLAAPTPLLMTTSTTRTTTRCLGPPSTSSPQSSRTSVRLCSILGWRIWPETRSLSPLLARWLTSQCSVLRR